MACRTRTVYLVSDNKGLSSTFQAFEEGRSIQRLKRCDKHGDKDEDNSLKNVNNVLFNQLDKGVHTFYLGIRFICFLCLMAY